MLFPAPLLALALFSGAQSAYAAPASNPSQLGSLQCNIARVKTIKDLAATTKAVKTIPTSDSTVATAVGAAQDGLTSAQTAVNTIVQALKTGAAPPTSARDQVGVGLGEAQAALDSITSTDKKVTAAVTSAQLNLNNTIAAGQQVLDNCGSGVTSAGATGTTTGIPPVMTVTGTATAIPSAVSASGNATAASSAAQCDLARLVTVTGLADTTVAVSNISTNDSAVASAVSTAQDGLSSAQTAIDTIVQALKTGAAPPADARDQVGTGLGEALAALNSINSTDAVVTAAVAGAQTKLNGTITAGQQVIDDCGSGANGTAAALSPAEASAAQCSIARLSIVTGLADTTATVNNISTSDPAVASAVSTAQGGLSAALTAIDTIVQALQSGVAPPADARDQVGTGLGEALAALNSINSTDAGITAAVANAQTQLNDTITAGQQVIDDCGSGTASASASVNGTATAVPSAVLSATPSLALSAEQSIASSSSSSPACNTARLDTVTDLAATTNAVSKISTSEAAVASAVLLAQRGLSSAQAGVDDILQALQTGAAPPADARDQVGTGLGQAQAALGSIKSSDAGVTAAVSSAQKVLTLTINAGQRVLDDCGGSGAASASASVSGSVAVTAKGTAAASSSTQFYALPTFTGM